MKLKKILAGFMTICMLATIVPATVMAETTENCSGDCEHVAAIGTTHYDTVQAAVDAAMDNDTVTVIRDHIIADNTSDGAKNLIVVSGKSVTIDLNGKKIYSEADLSVDRSSVIAVTGNSHLILEDSSYEGTGTIEHNSEGAYSLLLSNGTNAFLTVNSGNYILQEARLDGRGMIYANTRGEYITVNGGTFLIGNVGKGANNSPWIFNVTGKYGNGSIQVKGGTFNDDFLHQAWAHEVEITKDLALQWNGKEGTEGRWTVVEAVVYITDKPDGYNRQVGYATLEEAIAADKSPDDDSITLLKDYTLSTVIDKEVTINGEGKTITVDKDITISQPITVKGNLTLNAHGQKVTSAVVDGESKVVCPFSVADGNTLTIIGGTFNFDPTSYLPDGSQANAEKDEEGNATGWWTIGPAENSKAVIGNVGYETVEDALGEAKQGDTIKVLETVEAEICDGVIVDLPAGSELVIGKNDVTITTPETVTVGSATVTVPAGESIIVDNDGKVTLPEDSKIEIGGEDGDKTEITVGAGGATIESGESGSTVTLPEGSEIEIGEDTKITVGEGGTTVTPGEDVTIPAGSKIEIGDNTEITVGEDGASIDPEGSVILPEGSKIETGEDTEITVGDGGANIDPDGVVTLPEGSQIVVGGTEIIVGDGNGADDTVKIDPENGTVIIPEGSTITQGNGTVIESVNGDLTLDDNGNVVIPGGGTVNIDGRPTVFPNGGGIDTDGTVSVVPSTGSSSNSSSKKYEVSIDADDIDNGSVKLSPSKAKKGATVTLTVTPDAGYELDKLVVLDKDGNEVELTDKGDGKFTFKMPRGGVEVDASFVEADAADKSEIVLTIGSVVAMVNGEPVVNDVAPIIKGERTFLPIRLIAEELGATVTWNEADQSVTIVKDDMAIVIYIGQAFALVNGSPVALDEPAFIVNGRTYLPLRFIAENLGAEVIWDGQARTVTIMG